MRQVLPEWGPRYGSFPLTLELEDSLDMLSHGQASTKLLSASLKWHLKAAVLVQIYRWHIA